MLRAAVVAVVFSLVAAPVAAAAAPREPGLGNGGYDVAHYDINLDYQPSTDQLSGSTTIVATATEDLGSFSLDFLLPANSVLVNNVATEYAQRDGKLTMRTAAGWRKGEPLTVVVRYSGKPAGIEFNGVHAWRKTLEVPVVLAPSRADGDLPGVSGDREI